jgi:signal transduction histidine kinase
MESRVESKRAPAALLAVLPDLVARSAHDLNNHLALILGKAELALMMEEPERYQSSLREICDAGQDARQLVAALQRVVSWSTSDAERVTVGDVLSLVERLTGRQWRQRGVQLRVEPDEHTVPSDAGALLATVLWRLVTRALDSGNGRDEVGDTWVIGGSRDSRPGVSLTTSRPVWDLETRAAISRALRTGEELPGEAGELVEEIRSLNAGISFEGSAVRVFLDRPC